MIIVKAPASSKTLHKLLATSEPLVGNEITIYMIACLAEATRLVCKIQ